MQQEHMFVDGLEDGGNMNDTNTSSFLTVEEVLSGFRENNYVVIGLYIPVFVTALLANVLVIWVVFRDQYMRRSLCWPYYSLACFETVTNYFLVNLSAADLLVTLVCMPNAAYAAYTSLYSFGEYTCKLQVYFQCVSVASSIFTITAMAVDRYLAITRPFGFFYRCFNKRTTVIVILVLWSLSFILFMPVLLVTGTMKVLEGLHANNSRIPPVDAYLCTESWSYFGKNSSEMRKAFGITWFIFMFVIPGLIMLFAYSMMSRTLCSRVPPFDSNDGLSCMQQRNRLMRSRKRVACILLLLAFVFAGCWLPYHVLCLLDDIYSSFGDSRYNSGPYKDLKKNLLLLGHANSALNPIIYCALSRKFRRSIKDLVCIEIHFTRRRQNMQVFGYANVGRQFRIRHAAPLLAQD